MPSYRIKHGHEGDFRNTYCVQHNPGQRFTEYRLLFGCGKCDTQVCTRVPNRWRNLVQIGNFWSVTVPVAKYINHAVGTTFLDKAKVKKRFVNLTEGVEKKKVKEKTEIW